MNIGNVQSMLPTTYRKVAEASVGDFESTTPVPKGANRHLCARAIDKLLLKNDPKPFAGLVQSEVEYVLAVSREFQDWADKKLAVTNPETTAS